MSELQKLLSAIEARAASNKGQDIVLCTVLREIVRNALGLPDDSPAIAPEILAVPSAAPEFPQYRVRYSRDGVEITRRRINSLDDLGKAIREDYGWATATPLPAEKEY